MGRKVFVTYKYGDTQVKDLNIYENNFLGRKIKVKTKVRHYVDELSEFLEDEDHMYKGEDDGQSLADFSDEYIASTLRDKIYDSSITIVFISKGMKNLFEEERDQWMPWEISFSLRESTRNGRTSSSNGIIAVVLPDEWGSYEYYITYDSICNCRSLNTPFLFKILSDNMFNVLEPNRRFCNGSWVYSGDSSYIQSVKWEDFLKEPTKYIDRANDLKNRKNEFELTKTIK